MIALSPQRSLRATRLVLSVLVLGQLVGCRTTALVTADPNRGFERAIVAPSDPDDPESGVGERWLRLQFERTKIRQGVLTNPTICYAFNGTGIGARFALQFFASNNTLSYWELKDTMIHLVPVAPRDGEPERPEVRREKLPSRVIASVAPETTSRFSVAFNVCNVDLEDKDSPLWGRYDLVVFDNPVDDPTQPGEAKRIVERRLIIGRSSPVKQAGRLVLFFTLALYLVGLG